MAIKPKVLLVNKKGEPYTGIELGEGLLHLNKGDELDLLNKTHIVIKKILIYNNDNDYRLHVVYE